MKILDLMQPRLRRCALACGTAAAALAVIALGGWLTDSPVAAGIRREFIPMAPNTALLLMLLGATVAILSFRKRWSYAVAGVSGAATVTVAASRLLEYATGADWGTDRWILSFTREHPAGLGAGRMSFFTAAAFLIAGAGTVLFALSRKSRLCNSVAGALWTIVAFVGLVFCLGYVYGKPLFYGGGAIPMALNTAVAFLLIGAGGSCLTAARETEDRRATRRRQRAQHAVTRILATTEEAGPAVDLALEALCRELRCEFGAVWLVAKDGSLHCLHIWDEGGDDLDLFDLVSRELVLAPGQGLPGVAVRGRQAVCVYDVSADARYIRSGVAAQSGLRGGFFGPIIVGNEVLGCLEVLAQEPLEPDDEIMRTMQDVSGQIGQYLKRKDAEEELRLSERRNKLIIETANDAFIETDSHGTISDWNRQAEETFGRSRSDAVGRNLADTVLPGADRRAREVFEELVKTGASPILDQRIETVMVRRGGEEFPAELTVWRIEEGGALRYNAFVRDISARKRAEAELAARTAEMESELEIAREFQEALLPHDYPQVPPPAAPDPLELHFHHYYKPAFSVGGDYFDVVKLSDHRAGIFIADVMGHGARSALITAILRTLVQDIAPQADDPGRFLSLLNQHYMDIVDRSHQFVFASAFYLIADTEKGVARFASAGHPSPLTADREAGQVSAILDYGNNGPALGFVREAAYESYQRPLKKGDVFLLFTDGVVEAANPFFEEFGYERLGEVLRENLHRDLPDMTRAVIDAVFQFTDSVSPADDLCLVAVEASPRAPLSSGRETPDASQAAV